MGLAHVSVERFQVELQLPEVFRHKLPDLEFDGHEARKLAMEEEQVEHEILTANLEGHLASNKAEVAAELCQESAHVLHEAGVEVSLTVTVRQVEKLDEVGIAENCTSARVDFSQRS